MKWRCAWCGKPHERNDPPCEECGHHAFERAVVPKPPEDAVEDHVWVCVDCDRVHPRNTPPCSRCGGMQLEQYSADYLDPGEVAETGWLDVVEPTHVVLALLALGLAAVLGLGYLGVIDLPGVGPPTVTDVPGESEGAAGLSLPTVEDAYVDALNDRRAADGRTTLERDGTLGRMATYYNQRRVKATYGNGEPVDARSAFGEFRYDCPGPLLVVDFRLDVDGSLSSFDGEAALAEAILERYATGSGTTSLESPPDAVGIDVHVAPDETVYVVQLVC